MMMEKPRRSNAEAAPAAAPAAAPMAPMVETDSDPNAVAALLGMAPPSEGVAAELIASAPEASAPAEVEVVAAPAPVEKQKTKAVTTLTSAERREFGMQAELYSIMRTMEALEGAFVKGILPNDEYEKHCQQILAQFKTLSRALQSKIPDVRAFLAQQGIKCPLAEERLLGTGVAATMLHKTGDAAASMAFACSSTTSDFITLMNAIQLGQRSVYEVMPLLRDLQSNLVKIPSLPVSSLQGVGKMAEWLATLNNMRAADNLSDNQVTQLDLDVQMAFTSFNNWLREQEGR